ncbi:cupin domain-containing protein [Nitrosomonas sp. Nm34]|uniref:cupin domain-containing protein n=1 Tax=Nitrosomonas sp. Nm34 TaxID=1881055 RepID=UPI0008EE3EE2|nr:cupin domain-containing protein [Nitrosomonas sp. Nm34]SFI45949.1 hypothetical protein SAMN05428978_101142 [Nitrosomonas sp. Nm34]
MFIVHSDIIVEVPSGTTPNYDQSNPLLKLMNLMERSQLAAEREFYLSEHLQYLFPYHSLTFYGPQGGDAGILDPSLQDNKTDFQKQNVKEFVSTDTVLIRGLVTIGNWTGPFLRVSYRGGPDSQLSASTNNQLGEKIKLWIKVANVGPIIVLVPYNPRSDRYEVEFWGYPGSDLTTLLDTKGLEALQRGELIVQNALVQGNMHDFNREKLNDLYMINVAPSNSMHPILPLHIELAWADFYEQKWDSQNGANYHYEFNMILRGWDNFLGAGISPNPHGGVGFLEYRNLMSNYGYYSGRNELGRQLNSWNFNAFGTKNHNNNFEPFFTVDYMDLHLLKARCGIGLHRHRDNQEMFLMMEGQGFMVIGDWLKMPQRERCFEIRTLRSGHFAMLKGGNLHALINATDEDISLFMCGGYD